MEKLILVNKKDEVIGLEEKLKCHLGKGILHRAFTTLIFNEKGQLLITKRSKNKLLWPLCWEASCTSHPFKNENYKEAAKRRLREELRLKPLKLKLIAKFQYRAPWKKVGSENEICVLFVGKYNGKINPNPKEVADFRWIDLKDLKKAIVKNPSDYAPWLEIALKFIKK